MTSAGPAERLTHGRDTLRTLFPGSTVTDGRNPRAGSGRRVRPFALLPSTRHPRLLVPVTPHAAAGAALRAYGGRLSTSAHLGYRGMATAVGTVGAGRFPGRLSVIDDADAPRTGIDDHLGAVINEAVAVAIHLTPARANRKPIVQALAPRHRYPVAFAKVATTALSTTLVAHEAASLRWLAEQDTGMVIVPPILDEGAFDNHQTLVMRALPTWSRGRLPTEAELTHAAADISSTATAVTTNLPTSAFWARLRADIEQVAAAGARDSLRGCADRVESFAGDTELTVGPSHGDWSPWNMWRTRDGLLVWDWERFADDVPIGSDLVHYRLQELLVSKRTPPLAAARAALASAPAPLVGVVHLLALAVRYDKDSQTAAIIKPSDEWLLPAVEEATRSGRSAGRAA
jgi:hypothetical protein